MASFFKSNTTYDPIKRLLNAETRKERDELTEQWRDHKLQELNFIGVVGALLAGMLSGTGSWPSILSNGTEQPWTVRACWYCGILLSLAAVLASLQQSIRLHRLSCNPEAAKFIRRLLSQERPDKNGVMLPRRSHVLVWQMSVYFLALSAVAMLGGMFVLIWSSTGHATHWWNGDAKLAVAFSIVAFAIACIFLFEQVALYSWSGRDDSEEENESRREK